jgi:predicted nucleic acid-binding protein
VGDLIDTLRTHHTIGLDTPVFVYHIEQSQRWAIGANRVLRAVANGNVGGVTSVLTLLELSVKPLRLGRPEVADAYELVVWNIRNLVVAEIDARVSRIGAELRAKYWLRTADSLQVATCLAHGASAFVTNDRRLRRINEIEVLLLDDFSES